MTLINKPKVSVSVKNQIDVEADVEFFLKCIPLDSIFLSEGTPGGEV